jgi:hypothetical protein
MDSDGDTACAVGCPIRRSRDQRALASTPGFSQRATSFIASRCQGIHQMPLPQRLIAKTRRLQRQALLTYRPSREDTPEQRTDDRRQMTDVTRIRQPIRRPAFTESNPSPSAPRRQPKAPSAHSLFTCQRSIAHELSPMGKPAFPDRLSPLRARPPPLSRCQRTAGAARD